MSGTKLSLNDSKAINFVGDVLEGNTNYSFNPGRYFNLANYGMHNQLHIVIAGLSIDVSRNEKTILLQIVEPFKF